MLLVLWRFCHIPPRISHQERHAAILVCYVDFSEREAFSMHARKYVIHVMRCVSQYDSRFTVHGIATTLLSLPWNAIHQSHYITFLFHLFRLFASRSLPSCSSFGPTIVLYSLRFIFHNKYLPTIPLQQIFCIIHRRMYILVLLWRTWCVLSDEN